MARHLLRFRLGDYVQGWMRYSEKRGMSKWHDWIDWVGGYPYEVARPEEIIDFFQARGFQLIKLRTLGMSMSSGDRRVKAELLKTPYFEDNIACHFTASFAAVRTLTCLFCIV